MSTRRGRTHTLGTALEAIFVDRDGSRRHVRFAPSTRVTFSADGRRLVICGPELELVGEQLPGRITEIAYRHLSAGPRLHKFPRRGARMTFNARAGCLSITGVRVAPFIAD